MRAWVGTSGFSYSQWKGDFYPEGLNNADMLGAYGRRLPAVELNNTFYRLPRRSVVEAWRQQTPERFRFSVKASRRITHFAKLRDCAALLEVLFDGLEPMGPRLGTVLFQMPPTVRLDLARLHGFFEQLPPSASDVRLSFEFRHASWFVDEVFEVLRSYGAGLCMGEGDDEGRAVPPFVTTARFAYLRLRKAHYDPGELETWASKISETGADDVFVFFKHEQQGPHLALELLRLLGAH